MTPTTCTTLGLYEDHSPTRAAGIREVFSRRQSIGSKTVDRPGVTSGFRRTLLFLIPLVWPSSADSSETVSYHLSYEARQPNIVNVRIDLPQVPRGPHAFVMPRAIPMGYAEVPYDRFVKGVRASSVSGNSLLVKREPGCRWRIGSVETTVARVEYVVNVTAMERKLLAAADASKIRPAYLGLLGYSVFGYIDGLEDREIKLSISVPAEWPVFSTLAPRAPPPIESTQTKAANFYMLADSQILAGPAILVRKLAGRVPLFLALYSETDADPATLGKLIEETMSQVVEYFDSVPFEHYTVHYELLRPISDKHKYGFSMEHMDSCTIFLDVSRAITSSSSEREKLGTRYNLAHHFSHSWIPKRAYGEGDAFVVSSTKKLFSINLVSLTPSYDVASDGQSFVVNMYAWEEDTPITLVTNWPEELSP